MIYANLAFPNEFLPSDHPFGNKPFWLATYPDDPNHFLPAIPVGWSKWDIWQFTGTGTLAGLHPLDIDMMTRDYFNKY